MAVNKSGVIQTAKYELYSDNGFSINEPFNLFIVDEYYNCYNNSRWNFRGFNVVTDTAKNTFCRSPGMLSS